ncbi:MAG: hypothetical protein AB7Q29_00445 [Vicinamibacterales bacterium]
MKHAILGVLALSLALPVATASAQAQANTSLGSVTLAQSVTADGKRLAPGTYQVRLTGEEPKPAAGQSPEGAKYVEFVRGGQVVAREVATVISDTDVKTVVKGPQPARGGSRVEMLKGNDYVRIWINRGGNNYLIHLPPAV